MPHYNEYMKPLGIEYQTLLTLDIPGHIAGITVNRGANFTDKESTFLTLLAPHLAMASCKLKRLESPTPIPIKARPTNIQCTVGGKEQDTD
jgi:hypothetical protein